MSFYRDLDGQLCQGDLLDEIPSLHLDLPIGAIREVTLPGSRRAWDIVPPPPESATRATPGTNFKVGEKVPVMCQISRAIVLTHGCDIDNDRKHRLVALVRPLAAVPNEHKAVIRDNRNSNYFFLPEGSDRGLSEAYVDFRRITCLKPSVIDAGVRIASLTDEALFALQAQLFRFLTRRTIVPPHESQPNA